MALKLFLLLSLLLLFSTVAYSQRQPILSTSYYQKKCPRFEQIMQDTTTNKQITSPTTAAATLRLFFHDCFVGGCDASVLISSTPFNKAERDADINLSLPGDGFDVVVRAKTALELACPGVVSCADILAAAARNLVLMMGGPYYTVKLGRKDSLISKASYVEGNLPRPTMPMNQIIQIFTSRGFSIQEMVALSGAHTIGFSHCKEFSSIPKNFCIKPSSVKHPSINLCFRSRPTYLQFNPTPRTFWIVRFLKPIPHSRVGPTFEFIFKKPHLNSNVDILFWLTPQATDLHLL